MQYTTYNTSHTKANMKVNGLFPIAFNSAPNGLKRKYCEVIREILNARAELGFKNDVDVVFENIHEIFTYLIGDIDEKTAKFYCQVVNDIAKWLNKDVHITCDDIMVFDDEESDTSDEDDVDTDDEESSDEESDDYDDHVTLSDLDAAVQDIKNTIKKEQWAKWTLGAIGYVLTTASYGAFVYYVVNGTNR